MIDQKRDPSTADEKRAGDILRNWAEQNNWELPCGPEETKILRPLIATALAEERERENQACADLIADLTWNDYWAAAIRVRQGEQSDG